VEFGQVGFAPDSDTLVEFGNDAFDEKSWFHHRLAFGQAPWTVASSLDGIGRSHRMHLISPPFWL
jgi:hypothetical protein